MAEAIPTMFETLERDGSVAFDEVKVHRTVETDEAGLSTIHVWVTGRAISHDDDPFETLSADIAFSLFDTDKLLGICSVQGVAFDANEQSRAITADEGLHIGLAETVSKVEARVEVTKVIRTSTKLTFEAH